MTPCRPRYAKFCSTVEGVWATGEAVVAGRPGHWEFITYSDHSAIGSKVVSQETDDPELLRAKLANQIVKMIKIQEKHRAI